MSNFTKLVPLMPLDQINTGIEPCPTPLLISLYGLPRAELPEDCKANTATSDFWAARFVTEDVGPFRATGHRLAVGLLRDSLLSVEAKKPKLYAELGTAGMLCIRHVRGVPGLPSNHALGLAIDLTISGELDVRGDRQVMSGLIDVYSIFKKFGWFWGAEFGTEDAMHFEVGSAVVRGWIKAGAF